VCVCVDSYLLTIVDSGLCICLFEVNL